MKHVPGRIKVQSDDARIPSGLPRALRRTQVYLSADAGTASGHWSGSAATEMLQEAASMRLDDIATSALCVARESISTTT
jgi:hypothetical protein